MSDSEDTPSLEPPKGWLLFNGILVFVMVMVMAAMKTSHLKVWNWIPEATWKDIDMVACIVGPLAAAFCVTAMRRVAATVQHHLSRIAFVLINVIGSAIGLAVLVR